MAVVRFPPVMKYYLNNRNEFPVQAATVADLVAVVAEEHPSVRSHMLDESGNLRRHFNVFVNGEHIRELNGMDTPLSDDDRVVLMASSAGG